MKIEILDRQTVKIVLSEMDMEELAITYEEMDYSRPETRKLIMRLLNRVRDKTNMDFTGGKLFIEAFPSQEGGCILYLNLIEKPASKTATQGFSAPLIFQIGSLEELHKVCEKLFTRYHHLILKSSLYQSEQGYTLMLYSYYKLDEKLIAIVKEHGDLLGKGNIQKCLVEEHQRLLVKDKAIETIAKCLG